MFEKENFSTAKVALFENLTKNKWQIHHMSVDPLSFYDREFTNQERSNAINRGAVGSRTFYFPATHLAGVISLNTQVADDYAWVT